MGIRKKIALPDGTKEDAEKVEVNSSTEHWNEYLLEDNTIVKLKTVVTEVWRLEGEYDADGNPRYVVRSTNVLSVTASDDMRRPTT